MQRKRYPPNRCLISHFCRLCPGATCATWSDLPHLYQPRLVLGVAEFSYARRSRRTSSAQVNAATVSRCTVQLGTHASVANCYRLDAIPPEHERPSEKGRERDNALLAGSLQLFTSDIPNDAPALDPRSAGPMQPCRQPDRRRICHAHVTRNVLSQSTNMARTDADHHGTVQALLPNRQF